MTWSDHARATLQAAGYQRGGAREAVIELLASERCALAAQEIDDRLRGGRRSVGRASVYRSLELLAALKLVQRLDMGDGIARYEAAEPSGEHHHHVVCESCGQIEPFHDAGLERAIELLAGRLSFAVAEHEVVLRGECSACRN
jgi:Fur family transcriptional regulator, ferric uptake regulator